MLPSRPSRSRRRAGSLALVPAPTRRPTTLGPVLKVDKAIVRTGTCSWTDPTLVKETDWYPKKSMTAAERLEFYAKQFPMVEADSTYYWPPAPQLTRSWVERTPDGFRFNVKAYSLLTGHPTRPNSLWPDLQDAIKPEFAGKKNVYADHLEPDALEEAWGRFVDALKPLQRADRLGAVLFQYPEWFTPKKDNRAELEHLASRLRDGGVIGCVEFRSPRWLADDDRDRTLTLLSDLGLALVVVDAPPVSGLPTVALATRDDLAVVRFHGRANDTWKKRDITAAERFRYLYREDELESWTPSLHQLAREASEVHLLMNNCYQDYGVRNATDWQRVLLDDGAEQISG
jgi:uncharacterized protein YecE (DUF72 family)